ncbi:MAG: dTDP-4-dehydrorhamnose reductase [Candidatus Micrarchaeota archaeon]
MRILVIGGTGLVGNKVVEQARGKFDVHATYRAHPVRSAGFHKLEATDSRAVKRLIEELSPGAVINTSAYHQVDKCETERELARAVNVDAAVNMAEICAGVGAHYVYFSTEYVFDGEKGAPYSEGDETNPLGYYGQTKAMAEKAILAAKVDALIARTSVVYGWNDTKLNFATWAIGELEAKRKVKIVSDQVGNPTLADNLAEAVLKAVEFRKTGIFHIAGGEAIDRYNFTLVLADVFGLEKSTVEPVKTEQMRQRAKRPLYAPMSVEKAEKELDVKMLGVREGLGRMKNQRR